jgi:uncharacterized protein YbjT (DUF2867 family)
MSGSTSDRGEITMRTMRIAVAGATGNIGIRTVAALERAGHEVVRISRSLGVDLITGDGLEAALAGVEAVVDATSYETAPRDRRAGAVDDRSCHAVL